MLIHISNDYIIILNNASLSVPIVNSSPSLSYSFMLTVYLWNHSCCICWTILILIFNNFYSLNYYFVFHFSKLLYFCWLCLLLAYAWVPAIIACHSSVYLCLYCDLISLFDNFHLQGSKTNCDFNIVISSLNTRNNSLFLSY